MIGEFLLSELAGLYLKGSLWSFIALLDRGAQGFVFLTCQHPQGLGKQPEQGRGKDQAEDKWAVEGAQDVAPVWDLGLVQGDYVGRGRNRTVAGVVGIALGHVGDPAPGGGLHRHDAMGKDLATVGPGAKGDDLPRVEIGRLGGRHIVIDHQVACVDRRRHRPGEDAHDRVAEQPELSVTRQAGADRHHNGEEGDQTEDHSGNEGHNFPQP